VTKLIGAFIALLITLSIVPAAHSYDPPGERQWNDVELTTKLLAASEQALKRVYPSAERYCPQGLTLWLADDLGATGSQGPAGSEADRVAGRGQDCEIWLRADLAVPDPSVPMDGYDLCLLFAHERGHSELRLDHEEAEDSIMNYDSYGAYMPECEMLFLPAGSQDEAMIDDEPAISEQWCVPGWARRSSKKIWRFYAVGLKREAKQMYRKWKKTHHREAKIAKRAMKKCYTVNG
jgi:hypothetical protein